MPSLVSALPQDEASRLPKRPSEVLPPADTSGVRTLPGSKEKPSNVMQQAAIDPQRLEAMKAWMDRSMRKTVDDPVTEVVYNPTDAASSKDLGGAGGETLNDNTARSEEHTSELQSLMRISYAVFCLKKK